MIAVIVNSAITLCMLAIVFRWSAPWLELSIHSGRLAWLPRLTDPYIALVRRMMPPAGPMDLAPIVSVAILWMLRLFLTGA